MVLVIIFSPNNCHSWPPLLPCAIIASCLQKKVQLSPLAGTHPASQLLPLQHQWAGMNLLIQTPDCSNFCAFVQAISPAWTALPCHRVQPILPFFTAKIKPHLLPKTFSSQQWPKNLIAKLWAAKMALATQDMPFYVVSMFFIHVHHTHLFCLSPWAVIPLNASLPLKVLTNVYMPCICVRGQAHVLQFGTPMPAKASVWSTHLTTVVLLL